MKHLILLILIVLFSTPILGQIQNDTINKPIKSDSINISDYPLLSDDIPWDSSDYNWRPKLNAFVITTGYQYRKTDFVSFHEFDVQSQKQLSDMNHYLHVKMGGYIDNKYFELGYQGGGNAYTSSLKEDSTGITSFGWALKASFGYGFASKDLRFILTPYVGFQTNIFRYHTFYNEIGSVLPLADYLTLTNYNIKFTQLSAIAGAYLDYRILADYNSPLIGSIYLSLGAGYSLKLHRKPFIKVAGNELTSNGRINMNGFLIKASLRFYLYE